MKTMMKFGAFVLPAWLALAAGCVQDQTPRSYVQANAVQKSLFTGEWYYRTCAIRTDYESGDMAFPGDCSADWINFGGGATVPRIRWMIDQDYLFAIRSYEYIAGANDEHSPVFGEPVLAFKILSHFDIRRDYNPTTGEEDNVIVENTDDRHWADREYMRVDWSENLVTTMDVFTAELYNSIKIYNREPASFFVQEGSDPTGVQWPDTYRPRFVRTSTTEDQHDGVDRVTEYGGEGQLYYMDFVTQEIFTPGMVADPYTGQAEPWCMSPYIDAPICTSSLITMRQAFLKVPDPALHNYQAEQWPDSRFDQFGFWRLGRPIYDQGSTVDPADPNYGITDFWSYPIGRYNIWKDATDAAGRTVPPALRHVRPVYFYTTTETPLHILRPAVRIAAEWNHYFMKLVRILQGKALPSWDDGRPDNANWIFDPESGDGYQCASGPNVFGDCPAAERTYAHDPYGCAMTIDSRDHGPNVPTTLAEYKAYDPTVKWDSDFDADRYISMEGNECVVIGRVNSCIRHPAGRDGPDDPGEACEERGDLRYSFISWVDDVSTGWAGVAEGRSDPITGEFIVGEANCSGSQMNIWRTRVLTEIDMETGKLTEDEFAMGESYRDYVDNLYGNVDRPAVPQRELPPIDPGGTAATTFAGVPYQAMTANMEHAFARAQLLKGEAGRANLFSERTRSLVGSDIERVLFDNDEALAANDINMLRPGVTADVNHRLDMASLFRTSLPQRLAQMQALNQRFEKGSVMRPPIFVDNTVSGFVDRLKTSFPGILDRGPQLSFLLDDYLYRPLIMHEFGHVLGLRHNFAGSADPDNYFPQYYKIVDDNPMPDEAGFDTNGDGHLDNIEMSAFTAAQDEVTQARELAGVKLYQDAAVMDYTGNWYDDLAGLPSYDIAAMFSGYGDVAEVWEYDGTTKPRPDRSTAHYWKYYNGGEPCTSDADCPFSVGGPRAGELLPEQVAAGAVQTCTNWNTATGTVQGCSNFRTDVETKTTGYTDRKYKFCTDEEQGFQADCSVFDEGANYREIVHNLRDYWDRNYLRFAFRRYRYGFDYYPYISGYMRFYQAAQKIFQELFYKWAANVGDYRTSTEPFGFYDQYMACVDVLNWFLETIATPNVGSYVYQGWQDRWAWNSRFTSSDASQLNLPLGVGKYTYSLYQGGLDGINRLERIGTLYDKIWTMELMLVRDWGLAFTRDEPYFVNMYDLFPTEIGYLMTGLVADEPGYYMPRVLTRGSASTDTHIVYPQFWRGACNFDSSGASPCWGEDTTLSALTPLESVSFYVQMIGLTYGLSEIPTPFDPIFQEQATVYVVGSGGGARVPPDARLCPMDSTTDCDYATFTSDRFHRQYLAFKVAPDVHGVGGDSSLGFAVVRKAATQNLQLRCLEQALVDAGGEWGGYCTVPTLDTCTNAGVLAQERCGVTASQYQDALNTMRNNVDSYESFIRYLLELQGDYGLNTWITYTGSM